MMNNLDDFKIGEQVWCVSVCNFLHRLSDPELVVWLAPGMVTNIIANIKTGATLQKVALSNNDTIISDQNHQNFKTKNDAIDEIILELLSLKDK